MRPPGNASARARPAGSPPIRRCRCGSGESGRALRDRRRGTPARRRRDSPTTRVPRRSDCRSLRRRAARRRRPSCCATRRASRPARACRQPRAGRHRAAENRVAHAAQQLALQRRRAGVRASGASSGSNGASPEGRTVVIGTSQRENVGTWRTASGARLVNGGSRFGPDIRGTINLPISGASHGTRRDYDRLHTGMSPAANRSEIDLVHAHQRFPATHRPPCSRLVARPRPERIVLEGRYCRLEPLDAERHAADLHAAYSQAPDGSDWTYLAHGPYADEASYRVRAYRAGGRIRCTHGDRPRHRPRGRHARADAHRSGQRRDRGRLRHVLAAAQAHARFTEAQFLLMKYAFDTLGYRRYEWKCDDLNLPSRKAAARLGFRYEGTFRQAIIYRGRNRDTAWFSIIDGEWPDVRARSTRGSPRKTSTRRASSAGRSPRFATRRQARATRRANDATRVTVRRSSPPTKPRGARCGRVIRVLRHRAERRGVRDDVLPDGSRRADVRARRIRRIGCAGRDRAFDLPPLVLDRRAVLLPAGPVHRTRRTRARRRRRADRGRVRTCP